MARIFCVIHVREVALRFGSILNRSIFAPL